MNIRSLAISSTLIWALACNSNADGNEIGVFSGASTADWTGSGDVSYAIAKDESGNTALSASGNVGTGSSISLAIPAGDAAGSVGIQFRIRANANVRFAVTSQDVIPVENGGSCTAGCWDLHGSDLTVTPEWQTITLSWAQLSQASGSNVIGLDPARIVFLNWLPLTDGIYNIWLDDVAYVYDANLVPAGTGGTPATDGTGGVFATGGSSGTINASDNAIGAFVDEAMFESVFRDRDPLYTYQGMLAAVDAFSGFASCCSDIDKKLEVAAFLAHVQHESDFLKATNEYVPHSLYCDDTTTAIRQMYPCVPGKSYHGRGALQLTWNYNYGMAQDFLASMGKSYPLVATPEIVATDSELLWLTALWFWMEGEPNTISMHDYLKNGGFGATIRKINGGLECDGANTQAVNQRVTYFKNWCERLGIDPNLAAPLTC